MTPLPSNITDMRQSDLLKVQGVTLVIQRHGRDDTAACRYASATTDRTDAADW